MSRNARRVPLKATKVIPEDLSIPDELSTHVRTTPTYWVLEQAARLPGRDSSSDGVDSRRMWVPIPPSGMVPDLRLGELRWGILREDGQITEPTNKERAKIIMDESPAIFGLSNAASVSPEAADSQRELWKAQHVMEYSRSMDPNAYWIIRCHEAEVKYSAATLALQTERRLRRELGPTVKRILNGRRPKPARRNGKLTDWILGHRGNRTAGAVCIELEKMDTRDLIAAIGQRKAPSLRTVQRIFRTSN